VIVVAGEALVDLTPVAVEGETLYRPNPGGGPFNTAVTLGRLGMPTAFCGGLSTDGFGQVLRARLVEAGVNLDLASLGAEPTPLAVVTLGTHRSENVFSFHLGGTTLDAALDPPSSAMAGATALHVGTLGTTVEPIASSIEALVAREGHRVLVGFDPNVRPLLVHDRQTFLARVHRLASRADLVKVSDADAHWLAPGESPGDLAGRWLASGAGLVVVTKGADGAEAWGPAGHVVVPTWPAVVADTVGAGDAFNGGLLAWLHRHGCLSKAGVRDLDLDAMTGALRFAGLVSARTCERPGADPPWLHDLPEELP
jgi:fructokinase